MVSRVAPVLVVTLALSGACTIQDPAFGARCAADVDCGAGLVCRVDVCVPGAPVGVDAGLDLDAGFDPDDAGFDPDDAGFAPDPDGGVDAGPEAPVFNRAPRAFGTTVVVAADGTATVTLQGSDPDGDPLTFRVEGNPSVGAVTLDGAVATVTALQADGAFKFTVDDGELSDTAPVDVKIAAPANDAATTVYTGASGGSWNDGNNWSGGVPGQFLLNARVPAGVSVVVQSAPFNLALLEIDSGAVVELGGFVFTTTEARVGGEIRCTAASCLRATRVAGHLPSWSANDGARLTGPTIVAGRLRTGFDFVIDTQPLTALGGIEAEGGFIQSGSVLHAEGSVVMVRNLSLTDGVWSLRGTFVRTGGAVFSTGTHRFVLDAVDTQSVTLGDAGCFNEVDVLSPDLVLAADLRTCGRATIRGGARVSGAVQLDVGGAFVLEAGGRAEVAELRPRGVVDLSGDGFAIPVVRIGAGLTAPVLPYRDLLVSGNGQVSFVDDVSVAGALRSAPGDSVELAVGETTLRVGSLALQAPARLSMVFPDAAVLVAADAVLAPNSNTMSNGVIEVAGNLRFENASNVRYGDQQHTWRLTGTATLTSLNATALVGRLHVAEGADVTIGDGTSLLTLEPSTGLVVDGALTIAANTTLRLLPGTAVSCGPNGSVTLQGACTLNDQPCGPICP